MALPFKIQLVGDDKDQAKLRAVADCLPAVIDRIRLRNLDKALEGVSKVRICSTPEAGRRPYLWRSDHKELTIYPFNWASNPEGITRADLVVYHAFGKRFQETHMKGANTIRWHQQLVQADHSAASRFQSYLKTGNSYRDALERFSDPISKLTVVHLVNALIANSINETRAAMLPMNEIPATSSLLSGKTGISLRPLTSVYYGPLPFPMAFVDYCRFDATIPTTNIAVTRALTGLFELVTA
jgi:hypothetical protein